jgi:AmmeMemoRadiSam system protein B
MTAIRSPAVAGSFYPATASKLRIAITHYLQQAHPTGPTPKALIAPHAGYLYSGPVAASAYAHLTQARGCIRQVVLLGPAHWVPFTGLAASSAEAFATPLGLVPVNRPSLAHVQTLPQVQILDEAHRREHSLEAHIPFLQEILGDFTLIPLLVGAAGPEAVSEVLRVLWNGPDTLIVISSDLSHYYNYTTAQQLDQATSRAIETLRPQDVGPEQACGYIAINGLLIAARHYGLRASTVDLRNSGDTAGLRDEVVGYGAYVFSSELSARE